MKPFAAIILTASITFGLIPAMSAPAVAMPVAQIDVSHPSEVVQVRDDRHWRHRHDDRRHWDHHRRDWNHHRDWRRDRWRHDRDWHHHRRHGVVIRF